MRRATHRLIDRVSRDYERWSYNTAVAACMEFVNLLQPYARDGGRADVVDEAVDTLLLLLAPMTPHLAAEAWERRHGDHIHLRPGRWPTRRCLVEDTVTMVVQVNGKVRDRIEVAPDVSGAEAEPWPWPRRRWSRRSAGAHPRGSSPGRPSWSTSSSDTGAAAVRFSGSIARRRCLARSLAVQAQDGHEPASHSATLAAHREQWRPPEAEDGLVLPDPSTDASRTVKRPGSRPSARQMLEGA